MKTFPLIVAATLALALSACSGGRQAPEPAASEAGAPPSGGSVEAIAADGSIPEVLRGHWGQVPADCTSKNGDAKGLLAVSADTLTFYESVAKLGVVSARDEASVRADFEFSGEGESWVLDVTLSTPDGGKTLVRKDTGPADTGGPITYTKCP